MKILFIFYTFNRPQILQKCLETCFGNTNIPPSEVLIIDDGSTIKQRQGLFQFAVENSKDFPINFLNLNRNIGIGYTFELGHIYTKFSDPTVLVNVETDHIFRKGWLEDALAVFDAFPTALGIPIYSNPDYYDKSKTEEMFGRITVDDFGSDLAKREYLHKPFKTQTSVGEMEVQFSDHSCGSFLLRWDRVSALMKNYPEMQSKVFNRAFNKEPLGDRRHAGDGPLTGGLSWFWYKNILDLQAQGLITDFDYSRNGPWVDVCDFSLANHINGGKDSLNGHIIPEMSTFVGSPKFKNEYLEKNPRIK